MCLATIYRDTDNSVLMENTAHIRIKDNRVELQDLFGSCKSLEGCVTNIDLENNTVTIHCESK